MIGCRAAGHAYQRGQWLFRSLTFAAPSGAVTAILGPNGCGKTTLLRALCGIAPLVEGTIEASGPVGHVPQATQADLGYLVHEMVLLGRSRHLGRFGAPGRQDRAIADDCLAQVGIAALRDRRYDQLSGGQRQLVLLARALATGADILILDEPASALDLTNQGVVLRLMRRLADERGMTVLFTTHHPEHAVDVADHALMLGGGAPLFGPAAAVLNETNLSRLYGVPIRRVDYRIDGQGGAALVPLHGIRRQSAGGSPPG